MTDQPSHVARLMEANERLRGDRDVLLWLHAEAVWKRTRSVEVGGLLARRLVRYREEIWRLRREVEFEANGITHGKSAWPRPLCACPPSDEHPNQLANAGFSPPQCSVHTEPPTPLFVREDKPAAEQTKPYPQELFPGCPCKACVPVDADPWSFHAQMHLCPHCGNKRCPGAADHRNLCSGSNKPGQFGSLYADDPGVLPEGGAPDE